jgi:lipopolysaccharide biosynthesis glycosyltransferase
MIFCSVATNNYVIHLKKLLKSILAHNKTFNYEFTVFHLNLSEENKKDIKKIYPVHFHEIDYDLYNQHEKQHPKYYSFEAFDICSDKVVFLDADLICMRSLEPVIKYKTDLGMVREQRRPCFNAGMMIIGEKYLSSKTYIELLKSDHRYLEVFGVDQKTYNCYFQNKIEAIHQDFNMLVTEMPQDYNPIFLHFIHKPNLEKGLKFFEAEGRHKLVDLWNEY